jgi:UDP-glucose 4-epimerase
VVPDSLDPTLPIITSQGDQVTILDNFSTGSKTNIAHLEGKITTVDGDIRNVELVESLTKDALTLSCTWQLPLA